MFKLPEQPGFDESLFEYLQITVIQFYNDKCKDSEQVYKCLDSLGFKVGYSLIERFVWN